MKDIMSLPRQSEALIADQRKLDKILHHTKFNHRTKALWVYFRGNESVNTFRQGFNHIERLILLNLYLNGFLEQRLRHRCGNFRATGDYNMKSRRMAIASLVLSFRQTTIANWEHAVKLIDIAGSQ